MLQKPPLGFIVPDFSAPIDKAYVLRTLPQGTLKGFFISEMLQRAEAQKIPRPTDKKFISFKDYPLQEAFELFLELIPKLYPNLPPREAYRQNGHRSYGAFLNSLLGRTMIGSLVSINLQVKLIPKVYSLVSSYGKVSLIQPAENSAIVSFEGFPDLIDCADFGTLEGGFLARKIPYQLYFRRLGVGKGEIFCAWEP